MQCSEQDDRFKKYSKENLIFNLIATKCIHDSPINTICYLGSTYFKLGWRSTQPNTGLIRCFGLASTQACDVVSIVKFMGCGDRPVGKVLALQVKGLRLIPRTTGKGWVWKDML